jgi:biuret amidohydrolase
MQNCKIFGDFVAANALVEGSWGAEFHEDPGPRSGEFVVKHSPVNGFYGSQRDEVLPIVTDDETSLANVELNKQASKAGLASFPADAPTRARIRSNVW